MNRILFYNSFNKVHNLEYHHFNNIIINNHPAGVFLSYGGYINDMDPDDIPYCVLASPDWNIRGIYMK